MLRDRIINIAIINCILLCAFLLQNSLQQEERISKCRNYQQACAVTLLKYPELPELITSDNDDASTLAVVDENQTMTTSSSGLQPDEMLLEGSGEVFAIAHDHIQFVPIGQNFPLYDEFVPTTAAYDYTAEPEETTRTDICTCPSEDETCDFGASERVVAFNHQIRAAFCKPVAEVFKLKCKGTRTLARVIGKLDPETEDRLVAVNDTLVFCRCESSQWGRVMVEPWINNAFAFSYKCLEKR